MDLLTGLAISAGTAADKAKKRFAYSKKSELALLVLAAFIQVFPPTLWGFQLQKALLIATIVMTSGALLISLVIRALHFEEIWQESRTLSESAKKLSWLFAMKIAPYADIDAVACGELSIGLERLREQSHVSKDYLAANNAGKDMISQWMQDMRQLPWPQRSQTYLDKRLMAQVTWYESKARNNSKDKTRLFFVATLSEAVALIFGCLILAGVLSNLAWIGFLTTLSAGAMAYGETHRHRQLAISYDLVGQQLRAQKALWEYIVTEAAFQEEVQNTEDLISRENTNWSVIRS